MDWDTSNLITWMDHRCDPQFLKTLPEWKNEVVATGFGTVTLAWLKKHNKLKETWNRAGTIMDFVNAVLANDSEVEGFTSTQNAHGFAYRSGTEWTIKDKKDIFPIHLLPKIVEMGTCVGRTKNIQDFFKIPDGVLLLSTIGDVQASLLPVLKHNEAVIQLGTASNFAFIDTHKSLNLFFSREALPSVTTIPYFEVGESLVVSVGMNGGNVFDVFIKSVAQWTNFLFGIPMEELKLKTGILEKLFSDPKKHSNLEIDPVFYAERHNPNRTGATVTSWTPNNSAAEFLQAMARGVINILSEMLPEEVLLKCGIKDLRLVNRACQSIFEDAAQRAFPKMSIHLDENSNLSAAYGAACFAVKASYKY